MSDPPLSELGNAQRLIAEYGDELRYVPQWKGWVSWDGRRWARDADGEVVRRAKQVVRALADEIRADEGSDSKKARGLESNAQIVAMIKLATTEPGVPVKPRDLDAHPSLLNVRNGTINLKTGELQEHDPCDLITMLADVDFDPRARSAEWDAALERWVPDGDQRAFLQRFAGYTLWGIASEDVLAFIHGPTRTGKSTFMEAIQSVMGDYAAVADFSAFVKGRHFSGPRNDIARLSGARLVASMEVEDGQELAVALMKGLTGGDTITARLLYKEFFEFQPQFTIWISGNARPRVPDTDEAMWVRLREIPFMEQVPESERRPELRARFREDPKLRSAVLAWMVDGCLMWRQDGLHAPAAVQAATDEYRAEMDPLRDWLEECCEEDPAAWTPYAELRESYRTWAPLAWAEVISDRAFQQRLSTRGFAAEQHGHQKVRGRVGIRLLDSDGDADTRADADG